MLLDSNIWTYLTSIPGLMAQVNADNIAWIDLAEDKGYPRIIFEKISDPPMYGSDRAWQRWQFKIIHKKKGGCQAIADVLKENLNRLRGDMGGITVSFIAIINEVDPFLREDGLYEQVQDYRITIN